MWSPASTTTTYCSSGFPPSIGFPENRKILPEILACAAYPALLPREKSRNSVPIPYFRPKSAGAGSGTLHHPTLFVHGSARPSVRVDSLHGAPAAASKSPKKRRPPLQAAARIPMEPGPQKLRRAPMLNVRGGPRNTSARWALCDGARFRPTASNELLSVASET